MERKISFSPGEIYHIYNRGVNKQPIFFNDHDRFRFIILLFLMNGSKEIHISNYRNLSFSDYFNINKGNSLVEILAYCLMDNHFHLVLKEKQDNGISQFMLKLLTAYSMYFNKKHNRTGPLFEGRFKATHVSDDGQLEYLLAYVHLNPVKIKDENSWTGKVIKDTEDAEKFLKDYRFSSFQSYLGDSRPENLILSLNLSPEDFLSQKDIKQLIEIWTKEV